MYFECLGVLVLSELEGFEKEFMNIYFFTKLKISLFGVFFALSCQIFASSLEGSVFPIPFTELEIPLQERLDSLESNKVAVILGAGPAGLLSAIKVHNSGHFDLVVVVEKRNFYSRFNTICLKPEGVIMLREMGLENLFKQKVATHSPDFSLSLQEKSKEKEFIKETYQGPIKSRSLKGPIDEVISYESLPHWTFEISKFESVFAEALKAFENIILIRGEGQVSGDGTIANKILIKPADGNKTLKALTPGLIVVAEGSRSKTRNSLGISSSQTSQTEYWCAGSISTEGLLIKPLNHISTISDRINDSFDVSYSVFKKESEELFLCHRVPKKLDNSVESLSQCLREGAKKILEKESKLLSPVADLSKGFLITKLINYPIVLQPSVSNSFTFGANLILIGDCAGNGSPLGGLGFSLVSSLYMQALTDLFDNFRLENRKEAFEDYEDYVSDIVNFWHESLGAR